MAAVYDTDLKEESGTGVWYRWLGENESGTKQCFRLGKDKAEAKRRLRLIMAMYEIQLESAKFYGGTCTWVPEQLKAAKQIAKGKQAKLPRLSLRVNDNDSVQQTGESYARSLAYLNRDGDHFEAEDVADFQEAIEEVDADQKRHRLTKARLIGTNPDRDPTNQTVNEAVEGFLDELRTLNTLPDGSLSTWGKTQINQVKSWQRFMAIATEIRNGERVPLELLGTDLAELTLARAQKMIDATRIRPLTFESKQTKRMAPKSARAINKKIRHFFQWLDNSDEWQWWEPPRFGRLKYKVAELTPEEIHERKLQRERWRISDDEIKTLVEYATPVERVILILGLNCAFGAGEIGNLRIPYIKFETSEIDEIRFKTGTETRHHLWPETVEALQWELSRREKLPQSDSSQDIVFLSEKKGEPLWKKTHTGNYKNGVAKRWGDLLDRIQKDYPEFHRYSFGKLRKTAAIRVIELADAETASMILAHGIPSEDKILSAYVNIPWKKLYTAQEAYGETIRPLLTTERPAFEQPPKNYIGKKAERIIVLTKEGKSAYQVADEVGVSVMTVYRHLKRAGLHD